jgi:CRP-like cAMP-binding protein
MASRRLLAEGETLFRQGDPADTAYIVESGRIRIRGLRKGVQLELAELGPGELFGELALIDSGPRTADATALEPTTLYVVTRAQLVDRMERAEPMLALLLQQAMRHLRREMDDLYGVNPPPPLTFEDRKAHV